MKITAEPRSDQWNADDFVGGPRTFTISGVKPGAAEQKYDIELVEGEGRVWRPPLTMLRLLMSAYGDEAANWQGKRVTLYRDPSVRFGRDQVGGIRVSHLSGIDGPLKVRLTVSRGKRGTVTVQPLEDAPPPQPTRDYLAEVDLATDSDELRVLWRSAKENGAMTDELSARIMAAQKALQEVESDA